jgi:hypothetical protein
MLIYHNLKAVTADTIANAPTGALQKILLIAFHHTVQGRPSKCSKVCVTLAGMITLPMFGNVM